MKRFLERKSKRNGIYAFWIFYNAAFSVPKKSRRNITVKKIILYVSVFSTQDIQDLSSLIKRTRIVWETAGKTGERGTDRRKGTGKKKRGRNKTSINRSYHRANKRRYKKVGRRSRFSWNDNYYARWWIFLSARSHSEMTKNFDQTPSVRLQKEAPSVFFFPVSLSVDIQINRLTLSREESFRPIYRKDCSHFAEKIALCDLRWNRSTYWSSLSLSGFTFNGTLITSLIIRVSVIADWKSVTSVCLSRRYFVRIIVPHLNEEFCAIIAKYCKTTGLCGSIILRNHVSSPSTSRHEELPQDIVEAELVGRNGSCFKYQPQCPLGLFDLIGVLAWSLKNRRSLSCHFREINTLIGSLWKLFT